MSAIIVLVVAATLVAADQITKYLIMTNIAYGTSVEVLPGLVDFTYIHNNGAAFGMLQGQSWILLSVSAVVILICLVLVLKKELNGWIMLSAVTLVMAGGVGNMIDRIIRGGNVVDFIELKFVDFAIFNFADICVTIGAVLIVFDFIYEAIKDHRKSKTESEEETI